MLQTSKSEPKLRRITSWFKPLGLNLKTDRQVSRLAQNATLIVYIPSKTHSNCHRFLLFPQRNREIVHFWLCLAQSNPFPTPIGRRRTTTRFMAFGKHELADLTRSNLHYSISARIHQHCIHSRNFAGFSFLLGFYFIWEHSFCSESVGGCTRGF